MLFPTTLKEVKQIVIDAKGIECEKPNNMHILVHDGIFHSDDALCIALILEAREMAYSAIGLVYVGGVSIHRSRKVEEFVNKFKNVLYLVADVGGGKYDHHNRDRECYPNGVMYSAVGKILRDIPEEIISKDLKEELLIEGLYGVQTQDNGQKDLTSKFPNPFNFVYQFNANWTEKLYGEEQDEAFDKVVKMCQKVLHRMIENCSAKIYGKEIVKDTINDTGEKNVSLNCQNL